MKNLGQRITNISFPHFLILFLLLGFLYNLQETMFYRPQSLHYWRQTDCLSITQNYYQRDNGFFEPEVYNLFCDGGESGKTAGEIPLIYWSIAQLWKVTGKSEFLYRLVILILSFIGMYTVFRASRQILNSGIQAMFVGLFMFTSVTYVYYSANFLPNIPALTFVFLGWYFIWRFYQENKSRWLWVAMLFFALGMLLKVSAGISFCALLGWISIELVRKKQKRIIFKQPLMQFIPFLLTIGLVFLWYLYAEHYNSSHSGKYTFNSVWPIWELSGEEIREDLHGIRIVWSKEFFHRSMLYVSGVIWIFLLLTFRRRNAFLNWMLVILPLGSFAYALLWFQAFSGHDYYWIDFFPVFILVWILFFKTLKTYSWYLPWLINLLIIGFLAFNVYESISIYDNRWVDWKNEKYFKKLKAVGELEPLLRELGVEPDDRVISVPDFTINGTLYLMNQQGYCNFGSKFHEPGGFQERINSGAKYLVVSDTTLLNDPLLQPYTSYPMATYQNVKIFDLRENRE